jgi:hypothetical protein
MLSTMIAVLAGVLDYRWMTAFLIDRRFLLGEGLDASAQFCVWWCNVSKLLHLRGLREVWKRSDARFFKIRHEKSVRRDKLEA